jgi:outer membrane protein assembly factor BamB
MGLIYLVVFHEERLNLWLVNSDGEKAYAVELPKEVGNIYYPPIIGYDHRVYLLSDKRLMAFNSRGDFIWEYKTQSEIAGAVITADNQLLLTIGSELGAFEANGRYKMLYEFEGESLQTPPTLTSNSELLVASRSNFYCLTLRND